MTETMFEWGSVLKGIELLGAAHLSLLFVIPFGISLGVLFGVLPGMSVTLGMALVLMPSLYFDPIVGIVFISAVYSGGLYGGGITATLVGIPGTAAGFATIFDGYPMTKQGRQYEALIYGLLSSSLGALIGWLMIFTIIKPVSKFVLLFGPAEIFMLVAMALILIGVAVGNTLKSLMIGTLGLLIGSIGEDALATPRGTFGITILRDGVPFIACMIGLFALSEVFALASRPMIVNKDATQEFKTPWAIFKLTANIFINGKKYLWTLLRSAIIGVLVGILPAAGANVASMLSYGYARNSSRHPERYGKGEPEGLVAAEGANNSSESGGTAVMLAFGIPGGTAAAILMAGLFMHGLTPGPYLMRDQMEFVYALIISNFLQSLILIPVALLFIFYIGRIVLISTSYVIPSIIVFAFLGAIAERGHLFDVLIVLIFGGLGLILKNLDYPIISFILGIILSQTLDTEFVRVYRLFSDQPYLLLTRPIFIILLLITMLGVIVLSLKNKKITDTSIV